MLQSLAKRMKGFYRKFYYYQRKGGVDESDDQGSKIAKFAKASNMRFSGPATNKRETSNLQISAVSKRFSSSSNGTESRMQQKSLSNTTRHIKQKRSTLEFYSETRVKEGGEDSGGSDKRYESGKHIISNARTTGLLRMDYHNNQSRFHHQIAAVNG